MSSMPSTASPTLGPQALADLASHGLDDAQGPGHAELLDAPARRSDAYRRTVGGEVEGAGDGGDAQLDAVGHGVRPCVIVEGGAGGGAGQGHAAAHPATVAQGVVA